MSAQGDVQEYLQRHKIGHLFEELMSKVISEQPDEPIPYILKTLEKKAERMGYRNLRKTADFVGRSPEAIRKNATWAASTDNISVDKSREYEKPWKTNSKKSTKPTKSSSFGISSSKPGDFASTNVDDLWASGGGTRSKKTVRSPSPTKGSSAWATEDSDELLYNSHGYRGPKRMEVDDPLAGEFPVMKDKPKTSKIQPVISSRKLNSHSALDLKHKKDLEEFILKQKNKDDSGYEDDKDLDPDDAIELLENIEDLRNEGVRGLKSSGVKVRRERTINTNDNAQVKVSICARCAKITTGNALASEPAKGTQYGELPDFDYDSDREFPESRPQSSVRFSPTLYDDDEEFESVSQVTGPRHPVWQTNDSDGSQVFGSPQPSSRLQPNKSTRPGNKMRKSYAGKSDTEKKNGNQLRQTWGGGFEETNSDQSEDEYDTLTSRSRTSVSRYGAGWNIADDETEASSVTLKGKKIYSGAF